MWYTLLELLLWDLGLVLSLCANPCPDTDVLIGGFGNGFIPLTIGAPDIAVVGCMGKRKTRKPENPFVHNTEPLTDRHQQLDKLRLDMWLTTIKQLTIVK